VTTETIDRLIAEGPITAAVAAEVFTTALRAGRPVHPGTVCRWINPGHLLPSGHRVRLEGMRAGRKWLTSRAAITRFLLAQQPDQSADVAVGRTANERRHADKAARRELEKAGAV
jgi:hypothetical protein